MKALISLLYFTLLVQDSMQVDSTAVGYKVGLYIGSILPFILLGLIFLLIIRKRYLFKKRMK